jgi:hypothetical protein
MGIAQPRSADHFLPPLEGISETEIGLDEVVRSPANQIITSFAEEPDMGSKTIFELTGKVAEHSVFSAKFA